MENKKNKSEKVPLLIQSLEFFYVSAEIADRLEKLSKFIGYVKTLNDLSSTSEWKKKLKGLKLADGKNELHK